MMKKNNVRHEKKYHAEIMYETERGPGFCMAWGDTLEDFIDDIIQEMDTHRMSQLVLACIEPNGNYKNITDEILLKLNKEAA